MKTNLHWTVMALSLCLVLSGIMVTGCKSGTEEPLVTTVEPIVTPEPEADPRALPDVNQEDLLFSKWLKKPIYFEFDSSALSPVALATLEENAKHIKAVPKAIIQIAGHCDERGTQEYNLALGERRALAVRSHLIKLGVSGQRLVTISYGEEFPADAGHTDAAWAKNRRAEFNKAQAR